jgi:SulP family sulfate permease
MNLVEWSRGRRLPLATALREALSAGYGPQDLREDLFAGLVVGIVALPLSMALAIAIGVPPQYGLYTAIVGGSLIALLGGSRVQVSGPTAAFVVILAPIVAKHGLGGLCLATAMAGAIQVVLALARMGRLIQLVPYPVTIGFTAGIAIVLGVLQVKDFLGLEVVRSSEHFPEQALALARALPSAKLAEALLGATALAGFVFVPRWLRKVPAPLLVLLIVALAAFALERFTGLEFATIRDRFSWQQGEILGVGIPGVPPRFDMPWEFGGSGGAPLRVTLDLLRDLSPSALAIAMLGSIESLLSAVIADGMTNWSHEPDGELLAQGIGNLAVPFFGGFAATGALARTATNVRAGARSPLAAVAHALTVLATMLVAAPLLGWLPMSALAALLLLVAWNMSEARHVRDVLARSPRGDSLVLVTCLVLTVTFNMVVSVVVGLVLASLLFLRRMIEISDVRVLGEEERPESMPEFPDWLVHYEVRGPLFFGAAHRATAALHRVHAEARAALIDLSLVPVIDATGLANLRSALERLWRADLHVVLVGSHPSVAAALLRAGLGPEPGRLALAPTLVAGLKLAIAHRSAEGHVL